MKTKTMKITGILLTLVMLVTMLSAFWLVASAESSGVTVTIDTGASVTLKDTDDDGYYEIGTADELYAYATCINNGQSFFSVELTADIVVNPGTFDENGNYTAKDGESVRVWTPIGTISKPYNSNFDGGNYTISGLFTKAEGTSYVGLFGYVGVGTVNELGIVDSYFEGNQYVGSIAGFSGGNIINCYNAKGDADGYVCGKNYVGGLVGANEKNIINCYNSNNVSGTNYVGGVVGFNRKGNLGDPYLDSCHNFGTVSGKSGIGGVVGAVGGGTVQRCSNAGDVGGNNVYIGGVAGENYGTFKKCYNIGTVTGSGNFVGGVVGDNGNAIQDCYYLSDSETDEIDGTTFKTAEQFESGEVCRLIGYHVLNESCVCNTCDTADHDYENGFCVRCDGYQPAELNESGYYEIGNAGQLFWFAAQVNSGNTAINGKLTADIDLETLPWEAMGQQSAPYVGTFDGGDCTISNLSRNTGLGEGTRASFIYYLGEGGCIRNVTFDYADVFTQGHANANASAVVALKSSGTVESVVVSNSNVQLGAYSYLAGIVGVNESSGVIKNCAVINTVLNRRFGHNLPGGGIVHTNLGRVEACYAYGCSYGTANESNGGILVEGNAPVNSYYYTSSTVAAADYARTAEQFASGEVAYFLQEANEAWGQTLGENGDDYPVLGGAEVYYGYLSCADDAVMLYTNDSTASETKPAHISEKAENKATCKAAAVCDTCGESYGEVDKTNHDANVTYENGFCPHCDAYQPATLNNNGTENDTTDDYYEIGNAGQLFWFAAQVDSGNNKINVTLTANIVVNKNVLVDGELNPDADVVSGFRQWTPIGTYSWTSSDGLIDYRYQGTFDGKGHTVSGLYYNVVPARTTVGFFSFLAEGGTVQNVGIIDSYFYGGTGIAGIVARNMGGTVKNCYNGGRIDGGTNDWVGGIVGCNEAGTVINCYNVGMVSGNSKVGGVIGDDYSGTVLNCYYLANSETDSIDGTIFKSFAQFASGEVAYLLGEAWGQDIKADETDTEYNDYPILGGERVYLNQIAGCTEATFEYEYSNEQKEAVSTHVDENHDHICDYGCGSTLEDCIPHEDDGDCTTDITCSICGEVTTEGAEAHTGGNATCEKKAECAVCGKEYGELAAHSYVDGKCACGATDPNYVPPHEHNFVEGKCECGETDPNYTIGTDVPGTDNPEDPKDGLSGGAIAGVVTGSVVVLGGGGFALWWFVFKKKRFKKNKH